MQDQLHFADKCYKLNKNIEEVAGADHRIVLGGDFNATLDSDL